MGKGLSREKAVTAEKRDLAREFRREQTPAEAKLWQALRGRRLDGLKFRREQPVFGYIADFYCEELNLVVEVDGKVHEATDVKAADQTRQLVLQAKGLQVLRVTNTEVLHRLETVLHKISQFSPDPLPLSTVERGRGPRLKSPNATG